MRICFVVSQIFAWGKYGGFGSLTRTLGKELVKRGIETCVVLPKRSNQQTVQKLDGMTLLGYSATSTLLSGRLYKKCAADIYHSEEPSIGTYLAQRAVPKGKHLVTSQDPRTYSDWMVEGRYFSPKQKVMFPLMYLYEKNYFAKKAVQNADAVYCQAKYIIPKTKSLYGLSSDPGFLPNPVRVSQIVFKKADKPTVCFLARWDRRKRPEIFFELAKEFPDVKFIAIGKAHDETYDRHLRKRYSGLPNLEMTGFIDQFTSNRLEDILQKSWIMINTAARECLPVAFLEAAARKCAILSSNNPDDFAEHFGYRVENDDYATGLRFLLEKDKWRERGERGYEYVKETHELKKVVDEHIAIYRDICKIKS